jgi:pyridoxamine 5'-phosphate oxidase
VPFVSQPGQPVDVGFEDLDPDPFVQFARWFADAIAVGGLNDPSAMAIATIGPTGPSVRMVLLRRFDETGFRFFTNYESDKGRDLLADPRAAAVIHWDPVRRQVRIQGRVEVAAAAESDDYWDSRPRGSQLAAVASDQSRPIESRAELEARYAATEARYEGRDVERPSNWGGFRLVPDRIEFWQSRINRLHDRIRYERNPDGSWSRRRLMP